MQTEDQNPEELEQQTEEQAEAEFEAAFHRARGEEAPENDPEPGDEAGTEQPGEADQGAEGGDTEDTDDAPQPVLAGYTEDQIRDLLSKASRIDDLEQQLQGTAGKVFGKFGEVQRTLQQLQKGGDQTPTQQRAAQVTAEKLKRLHDEYPDIAELLAGDLSEVLGGGEGAGQSIDMDTFQQTLDERMQQSVEHMDSLVEQKVEKRLLSFRHPDWQTVAKSDEFKAWAKTLPAEEQQRLSSSWDSGYIAEKLDQFKDGRKQAASGGRSSGSKQNRLRSNVQPRGAARTDPPAISDEQAFMRGFKRARGGG